MPPMRPCWHCYASFIVAINRVIFMSSEQTAAAAATTRGKAAASAGSAKVGKTGRGARNDSPASGAMLALLLALVALGGMVYLWQQQQLVLQKASVMESHLARLVETVEQRELRLQQQWQANAQDSHSRLNGLAARLGQQGEALQALQWQWQRWQENLPEVWRGWELAEVDYLLRLAAHRLRLEHDPDTALQALQQAQWLVQQRDSARYGALQLALAEDIARVQALQPLPLASLAQRLDGLQQLAAGLVLQGQGSPALLSGQDIPLEGNAWQRFWQQLRRDVLALVTIRREDNHQPGLPPLAAAQLQGMLALQLESARAALLAQQDTAWQLALQAVQQTLVDHFDPAEPSWQSFHQELTALATVSLARRYPDLQPTLQLLQPLLSEGREHAPASAEDVAP